jgi:hypothetical protein
MKEIEMNTVIHEGAGGEPTTTSDPLATSVCILHEALDLVRETVETMVRSGDPVRRATARAGVARLADLERAVVALDRVLGVRSKGRKAGDG